MQRVITLSVFSSLALFGCNATEHALVSPAQAAPAKQGAPVQVAPAKPAKPTAAQSGDQDLIARGGTLVSLGGCGDCHTPMQLDPTLGMPVPRRDRLLSGHPQGAPEPVGEPGKGDQGVIGATFTSFRLPFGTVYSANLTPDKTTGLGNWTSAQFIQTMRTGHRQGTGRPLLPPMPWQNLAAATDADLTAIFAYLRSIPAIENKVPAPNVPAPVIDSIAKSYAAAARASH
ncbi:MAG TPA: hypothetical protein VJV78_10025 [Polyangiales bacterium]|nr:hypothetical protein [Polyangiales bacterium]